MVGAVIPAAGLSSRMGDFKPLMEINGFPMIRMTVQSAIDGGARCIVVVTGREAQGVREALAGLDVAFAHNDSYATSDMMLSVQLGLAALIEAAKEPLEGFFLLPGDIPAISPATFALMSGYAIANDVDMLKPAYGETNVHPPFISARLFDAILGYEGSRGLKGALAEAGADIVRFPIDDEGASLDADEPADFERLVEYAKARKGVSESVCRQLFALADTPSNVIEHTMAVSGLARRMARSLNAVGYHLDEELCASGGALHDILRVKPRHSKEGAALLRKLGYLKLADIVIAHDGFFGLYPKDFDEATIVNLADKFMQNDQLVTIGKRYEKATKAFPENTPIGARIALDVEILERLQQRYEELTHDRIV
ncbi:MAG: NTP transferase domain-containing protein [bacterium]|nr:NTP transferase domain-containing protein [bacterium]